MKNEKANNFLTQVYQYLESSGWKLDEHYLFWIDPMTNSMHRTFVAAEIQTDRDLHDNSQLQRKTVTKIVNTNQNNV